MAGLRTPRTVVPSRRRRDVHRGVREHLVQRDRVGRPTQTLFGFAVCFVASLVVVIAAVVSGQPTDYTPPLLNKTDQLVVAQWAPGVPAASGGEVSTDPTVSWHVDFDPLHSQPTVSVTWGNNKRTGPIYLFMDDKLADAFQLPCTDVSSVDPAELPAALYSMISDLDDNDDTTTRLTRVLQTDSRGATCGLKSNYATSANEPYVNVVTPSTMIARSDLTAPVVAVASTGSDSAQVPITKHQIEVRASTYPTDFRLDSIQASTNASEFNNGRLRWDTSDLGVDNEGQERQTVKATFEQLELKFISTQQDIDSGRSSFYSAIFLGLGLGVAAECMFRLAMDEHRQGDFWEYGPRTRARRKNLLNGVVDQMVKALRRSRRPPGRRH